MTNAWPQSVTIQMQFVTCCWESCKLVFGMPQSFEEQKRKDHTEFFCPRGHQQFFMSKSNEEKLKEDLAASEKLRDRAVKEKQWAEQQTKLAEHDAKVARSHAKRAVTISRQLRQRVKAGTCPCCEDHFENLAAHMKEKHPRYR
jgi:hypothetical protein